MTGRRAILLAVVLAIGALPLAAADATRCVPISEAYEAMDTSEATFVGTSGDELPPDDGWRIWPFTVHAQVEGDAGATTTVRLPQSPFCSYHLHTRCLYVIAADPADDGGFEIRPGHSGGATMVFC